MKISINKSAKRVLSIALALVMLAGTLFTANVGANITADAATDPTVEKTVIYWDSTVATGFASGTGAKDDPYIIATASQLAYLVGSGATVSEGKYFKIADNIGTIVLQSSDKAADIMALADAAAVKTHFENGSFTEWVEKGWEGSSFAGTFDGNGATVYGLYSVSASNAGLFSSVDAGATIKNIALKNSYLKSEAPQANYQVGGIAAAANSADYGAKKTGAIWIDKCIVANCYMYNNSTSANRSGVIMGSAEGESLYIDNCLVYGNDATYGDGVKTPIRGAVKSDIVKATATAPEGLTLVDGGTNSSGEMLVRNMIRNTVTIGTAPYNVTANIGYRNNDPDCFVSVYTDAASGTVAFANGSFTYTDAQIKSVTAEQAKGITGRMNMGGLNWADIAENPDDGGSYWYVQEDDYPTPIRPASDYWKTVEVPSIWGGSVASSFASGSGTEDDPYIIKTPEQLYRALSLVTDSTNSVAGGIQTSQILKQDSTTEYVPVYTPYYYKVADGVEAIYLNDIYGNESLTAIKELVEAGSARNWAPGKSFVGNLDGNGVTIYGMYNSSGTGLVYKLDGSSTVKNFNFSACYSTSSGNSALVTTQLGSYANDSTLINVANISVRNSYIATTRNITLTEASGLYTHTAGAAGLISTGNTAQKLTISNCLFDGHSCERAIGSGSDSNVTADMMGGIISGGNGMNNVTLNGCVSLGAPAVDEVYVSGKEVTYTRYGQQYEVFFYNCYSDVTTQITTAYDGKYDKLDDIVRVTEKPAYEMYDMPKLAWSNWALVATDDARTIPMPTVNTADELLDSYATIIGTETKTGKYASVGPYKGTNPYAYTLKGSGTEEDPYIIETDVQLARAIATGGMNLYDRLYYKLGNDIDISGGLWINQTEVMSNLVTYTYTPFGGTLDGDGHTVTGLTAGDSAAAGLIPVLDGGTVKNLHLRDVTVVSGESAGAIVGAIYDTNYEDSIIPTIENCSVEDATVSCSGYYDGLYFAGYDDIGDPEGATIQNCYYIGTNGTVYVTDNYTTATADQIKAEIVAGTTDIWYIGGKEGSTPKLKNLNSHANDLDIAGDGKADGYDVGDLTALRNNLLKKEAYKYINGDVSRNGTINLADLAILQRTIVGDYGSNITDSFFGNVAKGQVEIYYGENDNYDAARKVELYLESLFPGVDVIKHVSSSKGTVTGANSDSTKVYLHANDSAETPDGKLEIIVGNIDNYTAYATNTVATGDNTYAVTYDATNKVVWLQGANFTAVEQAAINFTTGCAVDGDVVYTVGSTVLDDYKQPITVKLDTNYDGTTDTDTTYYYAWGDEFEEDTLNTNNWQHNNQQSEGTQGENSAYKNQEIAPVKDLGKVITITNGRLSMKRGYDSRLGTSTNGTVALDVTPGEFNGYTLWSDNDYVDSIDTDGSDQYFSSGKIITDRGMLYKQGYIEFAGQLPADGHAFPAWWLMGRPAQSQTNNGYDNSLYSKVYKLNPNWNGSAAYTANNLDTYKYQIPSAIYEIDMIEVMQHASRYGVIKESTGIFGDGSDSSYHDQNATYNNTSAVGWYQINSTIHKWWNNGVYNGGTSSDTSDDLLYIHDWDNYKVLGGITNSDFSTTSSAGTWIHNIGSTVLDFGTLTAEGGNVLAGHVYYTGAVNATARDDLQATRKYGFSWNTNGVDGFEATLYVYNEDGTLRQTVPIASGMSSLNAFKDKNGNTEANGAIGSNAGVYSDAKVFNQYMYILFDNKYYSSNNTSGSPIMFTDLLTAAGLTSLEIDYVRVYQEDGARDIVTPETEAFNNNNHFGY